MPPTHVALIRGINVGKAKRVAMADLRTLFVDLGHADVQTILNSGNVVFSAGDGGPLAIAEGVERAMTERLGLSARVTVLTAQELTAVVLADPLRPVMTDPSRLLVFVLRDPSRFALFEPFTREDWSPEALAIGPRVAYAWCAKGILTSRLVESLNKRLGDEVTSRNWKTMLKLLALVSS